MNCVLPPAWHAPAHELWLQQQSVAAIQCLIGFINQHRLQQSELSLQLAYYLFMLGDYAAAATVLAQQLKHTPSQYEVRLNLAVCYSRLEQYAAAIVEAKLVLAQQPEQSVMWDVLAKCHAHLGEFAAARQAGSQSLWLKDCRVLEPSFVLPTVSPRQYALAAHKHDVIAFGLWGRQARYLRGALQNCLRARQFFPNWRLRFYVDESVPVLFCDVLQQLAVQLVRMPAQQSLRDKLTWRFQVANDESVGYFLVRDVDSVFTQREKMAVEAWLASDYWFHVMRDWWTHTDLMLAGMWGGVAGVLPNLSSLLQHYQAQRAETPNIDQWFLAQQVWPYVRQSCLIHDRYFQLHHSQAMPSETPSDHTHIGQDEFAVRAEAQWQELQPLLQAYPSLTSLLQA